MFIYRKEDNFSDEDKKYIEKTVNSQILDKSESEFTFVGEISFLLRRDNGNYLIEKANII